MTTIRTSLAASPSRQLTTLAERCGEMQFLAITARSRFTYSRPGLTLAGWVHRTSAGADPRVVSKGGAYELFVDSGTGEASTLVDGIAIGRAPFVHALIDPHLNANMALGDLRFGKSVVDFRTEGGKGNRARNLLLAAGHFCSAQSPGQLNLDSLGAHPHRGLDRLLHGPPEGDAALELHGDVVGDQRRAQLGLLDLFHVQLDVLADHLLQLGS